MVRLAISTCPNDTFAFHALMNRKIDWRGIDFQIELLDIQQLNSGLFDHRFDVAKASFHAALLLTDEMLVLPSGSALGFGVGPLLLAAQPHQTPDDVGGADGVPRVTLCPGETTTATLLYRLCYADSLTRKKTEIRQRLFSEIMPALKTSSASFGVCIHEGRFTWRDQGLSLVRDLGSWWECESASPLPLGGILANRALGQARLESIQAIIRESIEYGIANREETLPTMRRYAQEFDDQVLLQHVDLYVNQWTIDLGDVGRLALAELADRATEAGILPLTANKLEVFTT